jgi:N-acetylglutamate synthase
MSPTEPLAGLGVGMRAVVRHRIEGGLTDAVGQVVGLDADSITLDTPGGRRVIARSAVLLAKQVPPKPSRRGAPHRALSVEDLQRVMVDGWPPVERAPLGDWLLRAAGGFTGRANSVLAVGDPRLPLEAAVARCESWYAARGLPPRFSVAGPAGFAVTDDLLGATLLSRGYSPSPVVDVMTAAAGTVAGALPSAPQDQPAVALEGTLSDRWWAAFQRQRPGAPDIARAVLTGSPEQVFAGVEVEGQLAGVARAAFAHAWAGVFAVEVARPFRGRGLAGTLTAALAREACARGIRSLYLQVSRDNAAAVAAYQRLGFSTHHTYVYLDR